MQSSVIGRMLHTLFVYRMLTNSDQLDAVFREYRGDAVQERGAAINFVAILGIVRESQQAVVAVASLAGIAIVAGDSEGWNR